MLSGYYFYNANAEKTLGTYIPLDTSDANAKAKNIESGYTAYVNGVKITGIASINHELSKYTGPISNLASGRYHLRAASNSDYSLFAGGVDPVNYATDIVEAYNSSLVRSNPTSLSESKHSMSSGHLDDYILFAGGESPQGASKEVEVYNTSLTRSNPTTLFSPRSNLGSTNLGSYILFAGGVNGTRCSNIIDACDSSLTMSQPLGLGFAVQYITGANINNSLAVFYGGHNPSTNPQVHDNIYIYNTSFTLISSVSSLSPTYFADSASILNYAIFAGGNNGSSAKDEVIAIDTSLTKLTPSVLSQARYQFASSSISNELALFGGGTKGSNIYLNIVDVYDTSLVRSIMTGLSDSRSNLASTNIQDYVIFAGGYSWSSQTSSVYYQTVDVYYES